MRSAGIILDPHDSATAEDGELYRDSTNTDALTDKTTGGSDTQIGAASSDALFNKIKKNGSAEILPINTPISLTGNGSIVRADSDAAEGQKAIGVTLEEIAIGAFGKVLLFGANMRGVLAGLIFVPGQPIYLSNTSTNRGFTNTLSGLTPGVDSYIHLGYADCAPGVISTSAEDIIAFGDIIARP